MRFGFFLALSAAGLLICGCVSREGALKKGAATGAAASPAAESQAEKQPAEPSEDGRPVQAEQQVSPGQSASAAINPSANPNQIPVLQIVDMAKQGVDEKVIIDKILLSGSRYALSAGEISSLEEQGVSRPVIDTMIRD